MNPDWVPVSKPKHDKGCKRGDRCKCSGGAKGSTYHLQLQKIDTPKCPNFDAWLKTLERRTPLTVTDVAREMGITRHAATKLLRAQQGDLLDEFTHQGGMRRKRTAHGTFAMVRTGEVWFVGRP